MPPNGLANGGRQLAAGRRRYPATTENNKDYDKGHLFEARCGTAIFGRASAVSSPWARGCRACRNEPDVPDYPLALLLAGNAKGHPPVHSAVQMSGLETTTAGSDAE